MAAFYSLAMGIFTGFTTEYHFQTLLILSSFNLRCILQKFAKILQLAAFNAIGNIAILINQCVGREPANEHIIIMV